MKKDKQELVDEYLAHCTTYPQLDQKACNNLFFNYMRGKFDAWTDAKDNSMKHILVHRKVYIASSPRTEPKEKRISKKELIQELTELCGNVHFTSMEKISINDLTIILEWQKKLIEELNELCDSEKFKGRKTIDISELETILEKIKT